MDRVCLLLIKPARFRDAAVVSGSTGRHGCLKDKELMEELPWTGNLETMRLVKQ